MSKDGSLATACALALRRWKDGGYKGPALNDEGGVVEGVDVLRLSCHTTGFARWRRRTGRPKAYGDADGAERGEAVLITPRVSPFTLSLKCRRIPWLPRGWSAPLDPPTGERQMQWEHWSGVPPRRRLPQVQADRWVVPRRGLSPRPRLQHAAAGCRLPPGQCSVTACQYCAVSLPRV